MSSLGLIASIGVINRTRGEESLHFASASTRCQQEAGHLTRKQHEHVYDAARAVFIFFMFFIKPINCFNQNELLPITHIFLHARSSENLKI